MQQRARKAVVVLVAGLFVAAVATASPAKTRKPKRPPPCPSAMIEVEGDYCPSLEQTCLAWLPADKGSLPRCAEFADPPSCPGPTVKKHFCIDKFEYPNEAGKRPAIMKSWQDAATACQAQGKRLCGDTEWTLACEGNERLPYPYGTKRDASACNIDKPQIDVVEKKLADATTRPSELARLWQGEASGARSACVSPFGVFDMTGNVDEWVVNESGTPFKSGLKGGYWGRVRDACRPMSTAHDETFSFYQTGFRCCADPTMPKAK